MNFKRKLLIFLISFCIIIPINTFAYSKYLIPGGENIGIKVNSDGVYVVGFYKVNGKEIAKEAGFLIGDRIVNINNDTVTSVNDLISKISSTNNSIDLKIGYIRDNKLFSTNLSLTRDKDGTYKTGITGIGTLTYINPEDSTYGALGHEIVETSSNVNFEISSGKIYDSQITSITKASLSKPGEKNAKINQKKVIGNIKKNIDTGIYGEIDLSLDNRQVMEVANIDEVQIGKAEIITVLNGNKKDTYEIEILSIDKKESTRNFLIKVVDERLLSKTGGIIKGMSGSPIIQNGKIVGAITHTLLDNPKKGFGISITKMLESGE